MVERHDALHDPGNSSSRLEVANLRLDGANCNMIALWESIP